MLLRKIFGVGLLMLTLTARSPTNTTSEPVAPSRRELCLALARNPETDPLCNIDHSPMVLLENVFVVGVSTRQQVEKLLGAYQVDSKRTGFGIRQTYLVQRNLIGSHIASFSFDKDDILTRITIQD